MLKKEDIQEITDSTECIINKFNDINEDSDLDLAQVKEDVNYLKETINMLLVEYEEEKWRQRW